MIVIQKTSTRTSITLPKATTSTRETLWLSMIKVSLKMMSLVLIGLKLTVQVVQEGIQKKLISKKQISAVQK